MSNAGGKNLSRRQFLTQSALGLAALGLGSRTWAVDATSGNRPKRKLGIALCGLGQYSTHQLGPALRETKFCKLAAVVTGDPDKGKRWAREYGFPESSVYGYDTIHDMSGNEDVDILYSVTPPSLHMRDTLRGFEAGKHVISEKPMAMTADECDRMIEAAKTAGKQLSIGYRLHFHPYYERLMKMAAEGDKVFTEIKGANAFNYTEHGTWRLERDMGGGPMMDLGVYVLYCAAMAKNGEGPVAVVSAEQMPKTRPDQFDDVEEGMRFTLEYADGSTCEGETSWSQRMNDFKAKGDEHKFKLSPCFGYGGLRGKTDEGPLPVHHGFNQQAAQMDAFALAIMEGRRTTVPGELGRRDIHTIQGIFEAARTGKRVAL